MIPFLTIIIAKQSFAYTPANGYSTNRSPKAQPLVC